MSGDCQSRLELVLLQFLSFKIIRYHHPPLVMIWPRGLPSGDFSTYDSGEEP